MPLDPEHYTQRHCRPTRPTRVEFIAYERRAGGWDVFVFEPVGVCPPEWERVRVDPQHLHVATMDSPLGFEEVVGALEARLGPEYEQVAAYREPRAGERGGVQRRLQWLHRAGATGYAIRPDGDGHAVLWVRRKDLPAIAHLADRFA